MCDRQTWRVWRCPKKCLLSRKDGSELEKLKLVTAEEGFAYNFRAVLTRFCFQVLLQIWVKNGPKNSHFYAFSTFLVIKCSKMKILKNPLDDKQSAIEHSTRPIISFFSWFLAHKSNKMWNFNWLSFTRTHPSTLIFWILNISRYFLSV